MNRLHLAAALVTSLAAGCGGPLPVAPAPPAPPATTAEAAPAPPAPATVAAAPSAAPVAAVRSAFTKVANVGEDARLYPLGKRVFIGRRHGATFLEVKDGKIERADAVSPGLDTCKDDSSMGFEQPGALYGDFDKAAFLSRLVYGARTTFVTMRRWDGAQWRASRLPEYSGQMAMLGSFPWRKSTLLLVTWYGHSSTLDVLEGPDKAPSFTGMPQPREWQQTRMLATVGLKTRDGELLVAGSDGNLPAVERWSEAEGKREGRLETLPLAPGETDGALTSLAGSSSSDLYAAGAGGYLARFDGKQWTRLVAPMTAAITHLALAPDGALWASERSGSDGDNHPSTVWRRAGGTWSQVPASDEKGKPLSISGLWITGDGDVWLAAGDALYRSRPAEAVFTWADPLCPAISMARPATENCNDAMFVLLYTLVKTTPADYDFPLLRKAIKGHRELAKVSFAETEERGRRYFVGFLDRDALDRMALGAKLVNLIKKEVGGSTPVLLCGSPRVVRKLDIDLASGEVVKK